MILPQTKKVDTKSTLHHQIKYDAYQKISFIKTQVLDFNSHILFSSKVIIEFHQDCSNIKYQYFKYQHTNASLQRCKCLRTIEEILRCRPKISFYRT